MAQDESSREPIGSARLAPGTRVAAAVSRYHEELSGAMLESAREVLQEAGLAEDDLLVVHVPGAFEIPLVARRLAVREDVDAVLCLGLVLKGETSHDEHIARAVSEGVLRAGLESDKPVLFGVLTCTTLEQARARALPANQGGTLDKGREVARAAVEQLFAMELAVSTGLADRRLGFQGPAKRAAGERAS